jgi:hypothetical protein
MMTTMAEEVETSYRKLYRLKPKRRIPIFYNWNIGTDHGKHSEENQDHA